MEKQSEHGEKVGNLQLKVTKTLWSHTGSHLP